MLSRLRTSPFLRRTVWVLALLLPLSLNPAAGETCAGHAGASMPHGADMPMSADAGHGDMADAGGDCGDPACQAACGGTAAAETAETAPIAVYRGDPGPVPATALRAGHPHRLLRPPLFS